MDGWPVWSVLHISLYYKSASVQALASCKPKLDKQLRKKKIITTICMLMMWKQGQGKNCKTAVPDFFFLLQKLGFHAEPAAALFPF